MPVNPDIEPDNADVSSSTTFKRREEPVEVVDADVIIVASQVFFQLSKLWSERLWLPPFMLR